MRCIDYQLVHNGHSARVKWSRGGNLIYCRDPVGACAAFDLIIFASMNYNKILLLPSTDILRVKYS